MKIPLVTTLQRLALIVSMSFTATVHAQSEDLFQTPKGTKNMQSNAVQQNSSQAAKHNIYFLGLSQHFQSKSKTRNGNMALLGYSRNVERKPWHFENGAATFIDSYNLRSYVVFSNISHDNIGTTHIKPTIGLNCAYKGYSYSHDRKRWLCTPPVKFRIGKEKGMFAYVTPVPKISGLTNGLISLEVGYRY